MAEANLQDVADKVDEVGRQVRQLEVRLFIGQPGEEALSIRLRLLEQIVKEERRKDRRTWAAIVTFVGLVAASIGGVLTTWLTTGL